MKSISIVGATGLVGSKILLETVSNPGAFRVRVWTRKPVDLPIGATGIVSSAAPVAKDDFWQADVLFVALGTTIGKAGSQSAFRAVDYELVVECAIRAREGGTTTLAMVSAAGADPKSRIFYSRVKGEAEEAVFALSFPRMVVARPSLLLGDRTEWRLGEWLARKGIGPFRFLLPKSIRPIWDEEVSRALVAAALDPNWTGRRELSNQELLRGLRSEARLRQ